MKILSLFGDPDLELEPLTPTCLDQCATLVLSFFSPVSSPSATTVDLVQPNEQPEQPNPQTRSIPLSPASPKNNVLIKAQFVFLQFILNLKTNHFDGEILQDRTFVHWPLAPYTLALRITLILWIYTNNTDASILPLGPE